jgi:hypothetical protein
VFSTPPDATFEADGSIRIPLDERWKSCGTNGKLWELRKTKDRLLDLGFWGWERPIGAGGTNYRSLRGHYVYATSEPARSRLELLAWQWTGRHDSPLVLWAVHVSLALLVVSSLLSVAAFAGRLGAARRRVLPWALVGVALGTTGLWASAFPPFQAPDEPDHLLSYAYTLPEPAQSGLVASMEEQARRIHFERVKFRSIEKFNAAYEAEPYPEAWAPHVDGYDVVDRSPLYASLFALFSNVFGDDMAAFPLLAAFRGANVLLLVLSFGLVVLAWRRKTDVLGAGELGIIVPLLVPVIAFFGVQMSNYAFIIAGLLLLLASAARESGRASVDGLLLGGGVVACVLASRNGLPVLVVLHVVAVVRALRAQENVALPADAPARRLAWLVPWAWASSLAALWVLLIPDDNFGHLDFALRKFGISLGWGKFLSFAVIVGVLASGVAVEGIVRAFRHFTPKHLRHGVRRFLPWGLALGLLAIAVLPLIFKFQPLDSIERATRPGRLAYALEVVPRFLAGLGFGKADPYLVQSFWSGFGWLDVELPRRLVRVVKLVPLLAACGLLILNARAPVRTSRLALVGLGFAGATVIAAAQAFAVAQETINLHGRYLIISYQLLLMSTLAPLLLECAERARAKAVTSTLPIALVAGGCAFHLYAVTVVLARYFG